MTYIMMYSKNCAMAYYLVVTQYAMLQVDFKVENRTAIHVACANGSGDVLKVLLEYKASTEIPVSCPFKPIKNAPTFCDTVYIMVSGFWFLVSGFLWIIISRWYPISIRQRCHGNKLVWAYAQYGRSELNQYSNCHTI